MTFRQYIAEEIATDHADGLLSRREALRRLALLGLTAPAAATLLAACASEDGTDGSASRSPSSGSPSAAPAGGGEAVEAKAITFDGPDGRKIQGAWAQAEASKGGVVVVHENRGLTDHIRSVAGRLAADGYSALAPDLLSPEGGTASFADPAEATAAIGKAPVERFVADLRSAITELGRLLPGKKLGIVGFCFGGGMVWQVLNAGEPRLSAAVPFYGPGPSPADFSKSKAAVLAIYAEQDDRVNASRDAMKAALEKADLTTQIVTYPGVNHAFFNDTGQRYDADAAKQAYSKMIGWFGKYLA